MTKKTGAAQPDPELRGSGRRDRSEAATNTRDPFVADLANRIDAAREDAEPEPTGVQGRFVAVSFDDKFTFGDEFTDVLPSIGATVADTAHTVESVVPGELAAGAMLGGHYQVVHSLGGGAMGQVYEVEHLELRKRFAAKVVAPSLTSTRQAVERLRKEARVIAALDHENVVGVTHLGQTDDGLVFVVMELLEGEDLEQRMVRHASAGGGGGLPDEEVCAIVPQLLRGLAAAHGEGVVHRDLKPANVFLAQKGDGLRVKVVDFGISRLQKTGASELGLTGEGVLLGTPLYMAPEQSRSAWVDARADLYSFGCVLYEMLTGVVPFPAEGLTDCIVRHATEQPGPPRELRPDLAPDVEAVVLRCLEKDPAARFASASTLLDAWSAARAACGGGSLSAEDTPPRRRRAPAWGALGVAAVAVLALAAWLAVQRSAPSEARPRPREAAARTVPQPAGARPEPLELPAGVDPPTAELELNGDRAGTRVASPPQEPRAATRSVRVEEPQPRARPDPPTPTQDTGRGPPAPPVVHRPEPARRLAAQPALEPARTGDRTAGATVDDIRERRAEAERRAREEAEAADRERERLRDEERRRLLAEGRSRARERSRPSGRDLDRELARERQDQEFRRRAEETNQRRPPLPPPDNPFPPPPADNRFPPPVPDNPFDLSINPTRTGDRTAGATDAPAPRSTGTRGVPALGSNQAPILE